MLNCARLDKQQQAAFGSGRSVLSRYAIYYTPQPGSALANFGRSWFGRANEGATLQAFSTAGLTGLADPKISPFPGRYCGLHAVVLAPFIARDDADLDEIRARLINFAGRRRAIETGPLTLARSGRNLVLRPVEPRPALDWLAAQSINAFESFSVKPDEARHAHLHLSPYQRLLLKSFGHANVMSEYRFTITLTGPLETAHLERVSQALWPLIEDVCTSGVTVDSLSLFGGARGKDASGPQDSSGPMRFIGRYQLAG